MARPLRIVYEGAIYHVTVRGHSRSDLFLDDRDRRRFLERLAHDVADYGVRLYAYCLMTNHYHLVLETPQANVSAFMQTLQTSYNLYYNRRHRRSGPVTQGRFKTRVVEGNEYLLRLTRYVHLNPVQIRRVRSLPMAERIRHLRAYPWSSYRGYAGLVRRQEFVDYSPMLAMLGDYGFRGGKGFRRYVEAGLAEDDESFHEILKASPYAIGSEDFIEQVRGIYEVLAETQYKGEDAALRRVGRRLEPTTIMGVVERVLGLERTDLLERRRNSWNRAIAIKVLCRFGACSRREAARLLQMGSGASASMQLKALEEGMRHDRSLRRLVHEVELACNKLIT